MSSSPTWHAISVEQQESARYTGYQRYKSSDVPWLGQIPERWDTTRLKWLFRVINGATPKTSKPEFWDGEVAWATPEDLGDSEEIYLNSTERTLTQEGLESCGAGLVPPGSIILSTRAPIGYVRLVGQPTATNQGCRSLVPQKAVEDPQFYYFALQSARPMLQAFGTGATFQELSSTELGLVSMPVPPREEQKRIASFLRAETRRIHRLIEKKERLIDLLGERRTALITKAVTKGLDPDVPMKDSGVEWLGEIPKDWDTTKIGYHVDLINGFPFSSEHFSNSDGIPLIRIRDLGNERTEAYFMGEPDTDFRVQSGDIVIGMDGDFEVDRWSGKPALLNQRLCCLRTHDSLDERFLYYSLPAPLTVINDLTHSTTVKHLSSKQIRRIEICYPPLEVQRRIGEKVDVEMANLDRLAERIRRAIERLHEYRSALITAAVTGKIDVRNHAA